MGPIPYRGPKLKVSTKDRHVAVFHANYLALVSRRSYDADSFLTSENRRFSLVTRKRKREGCQPNTPPNTRLE